MNMQVKSDFVDNAPLSELQRLRSYSRLTEENLKETWDETVNRVLYSPYLGLKVLGKFTDEEMQLIDEMQRNKIAFGSARGLWVLGTKWYTLDGNESGTYNCTSLEVTSFEIMAELMNLAMMGCGTGAVIEPKFINQIPTIRNKINVQVVGKPGLRAKKDRVPETQLYYNCSDNALYMVVGDSREGWVSAYLETLKLAISTDFFELHPVELTVDVSNVRPKGEILKGFGGVSNPIKLPGMFEKLVTIINGATGRQLTSLEACLLIDEAALVVVSGNLRRSAGMRQGESHDEIFNTAKDNLWQQDSEGNWFIDPKRDALRMANHTRVFHHKPTLEEVKASVTKQFYSGEGAIQYAPEAIARANVDILDTPEKKKRFLQQYEHGLGEVELVSLIKGLVEREELEHRLSRYGLNPCFRGDMRLLTVDGYKTFEDLNGTEPYIINAEGVVSKSKVWCSGEKEIVELKLSTKNAIFCTPDHKFFTSVGEKEAKDMKGLKLTPFLQEPYHKAETRLLGFMQGDGTLTRCDSKLGETINIGQEDSDIFEILDFLGLEYAPHSNTSYYVSGISDWVDDLGMIRKILPERTLPRKYEDLTLQDKAAFLNGLYSANGSVIKSCGRVTLKTTCSNLADQVIDTLLNDFGIQAYKTTNRSKPVKFANGVYQCRESYDVNIGAYEGRLRFFNLINFSIKYKTEKLASWLIENAPYVTVIKSAGVEKVYDFTEPLTHWGVVEGFIAHNCGEILGANFHCNLASVHLNQLDPFDFEMQEKAFKASALQAAAFLQRGFTNPIHQQSREWDPIVGVSFTGLVTFFIKAFGSDWLKWWQAGRPDKWYIPSEDYENTDLLVDLLLDPDDPILNEEYDFKEGLLYKRLEQEFLTRWKDTVHQTVLEYSDRHGLKHPNRCTTLKPEGSLTLLTGVGCNGHHMPKGWYYIRRMTFAAHDPIALAAMDYGYTVVPSQSDKDENGKLLNDPFDSRCTEWLVEVPVEEESVRLFPEIQEINPGKFSALAQFDFLLQVQNYYVTHNTSATLELTQEEIEPLSERIYSAIQNDEGYISTALLARFEANETFPRLPFEPITKARYLELKQQVLERRKSEDFDELFKARLLGNESMSATPQDSACGDGFCSISKAKFEEMDAKIN